MDRPAWLASGRSCFYLGKRPSVSLSTDCCGGSRSDLATVGKEKCYSVRMWATKFCLLL